jgi:hypothetical protein
MNNIKKMVVIVLNADDNFYNFIKICFKKKLKVISFGIKK